MYLSGSLTGTCAEYALCDESQAHRLPDNTSMAQGACLGVPAYTAYRGLVQRCRAAKGESVLIHGASGAVGLVAVQLAMAAGCSAVVGTAGTEAGMEAIRAAGAHAVCHRQEGYLQAAKVSASP